MSTALAIAGVTAVLRDLLNEGIINHNITDTIENSVKVTAVAPDIALNNGNMDQPQINIYMYIVSPNMAWRNACLPTSNSAGQRINNAPLALNLHYLLTAYGVEDLQAEILLGYAMQLMHENPVLNRAAINTALNPPQLDVGDDLPPTLRALSTSGLADQIEQIKFTPEYFTTEEMSKLWNAAQSSYRPSAAYEATVVLIEVDEPVRSPLPVRQRTINTITLQRPNIDEASPDRIEVGAVLTLRGQNLVGETTQLRFGDILVDPDPDPADVSSQHINLTLPNSLTAGIQGVQVVHGINIGIPPTPHRGTESNVFPFVLLPTIVTNPLLNVVAGTTLTLDIAPPVLQHQRASIMLGEQEIKIGPRPDTDPPSTTQLDFPIPEIFVAGSYLLRLRIDGAESLLSTNDAGLYNGPMATVTSP